jgi:hypothetical protein
MGLKGAMLILQKVCANDVLQIFSISGAKDLIVQSVAVREREVLELVAWCVARVASRPFAAIRDGGIAGRPMARLMR